MTKTEFLQRQRDAHTDWERLLATIPTSRMLDVVAGGWTVKDIIAHVTWGEREMVGVLKQRALIGSDLWSVSQQERNDAVWEQNRARPLLDVLREAGQVYAELVEELEKIEDEELNEARYFREMPADWKPWQVIAGNTFEHYPEHVAMIREWLEKT